ncbi:MAG: LysM peptidoglycan-binding domain-containing M23 family metallopeptidase [Pseudomonadota bacterium]
MTRSHIVGRMPGLLRCVGIVALLGACAGPSQEAADVEFRGSDPNAPPPVASAPPAPGLGQADARGVIVYPDYAVIIARQGDTIEGMAGRVGLAPAELAAYNGLTSTYAPREGDTIVLPPRPQGYGLGASGSAGIAVAGNQSAPTADDGWSPDLAAAAINRAGTPSTASTTTIAGATSGPASVAPGGVEPVRHVVEPGETVYSVGRLYNVPVTAIAAWNGLSGDLSVSPGQQLLIPLPAQSQGVPAAPGAIETAAVDQPIGAAVPRGATTGTSTPGAATPIETPPSNARPLPEDPANPGALASPNLDQYRSSSTDGARFLPPVDGAVVRRYNSRSGPGGNDGIDYAAPAGEPIRAAADGEVALVSSTIGALAPRLVLIRHEGGIFTVVGRVDAVSVQRGDRVTRGQTIARVAPNDPATVQFRVMQGTQIVNPEPYL